MIESGATEARSIESGTEDLAQHVENLTIESTVEVTPTDESSVAGGTESALECAHDQENVDAEEPLEPLQVELHQIKDEDSSSSPTPPPQPQLSTASASEPSPGSSDPPSPQQLYDDPSDSDDGEGEWITPQNVGLHKSRALDLLPDDDPNPKGKGKAKEELIGAGCMTADFAMQNVLLQMGLNLVSVDGKRIQKVKNYVLRCHACFK